MSFFKCLTKINEKNTYMSIKTLLNLFNKTFIREVRVSDLKRNQLMFD